MAHFVRRNVRSGDRTYPCERSEHKINNKEMKHLKTHCNNK